MIRINNPVVWPATSSRHYLLTVLGVISTLLAYNALNTENKGLGKVSEWFNTYLHNTHSHERDKAGRKEIRGLAVTSLIYEMGKKQ